jgi:hypothetical protein
LAEDLEGSMAPYDESIPELIRGTIRDAKDLLRGEIAIARSELRQEVTRIKGGVATLAAAAIAALMALVLLLNTAAWGISDAFEWPPWAGFLIVAIPVAIIAGVLAMTGRALLARDRHMPKSVDTLKENAEWLRAQTR